MTRGTFVIVCGGLSGSRGAYGVYAAPSVKTVVVPGMFPPQTIIWWPVHTAVGGRHGHAEVKRGRAVHWLVAGL